MRIAFASLDGCPCLRDTLRIAAGDDADFVAGIRLDDDVHPADLTNRVVTVAVLDGHTEVLTLRSYDETQVEVVDDAGGILGIHFDSGETEALTPGLYGLAVRVHERGDVATSGTASFTASADVILAGFDFTGIHVGSFLIPAGSLNVDAALITAVDATAHKVTTAGMVWAAEASVGVTIRDGKRLTAQGARKVEIF